MTRTKQTRKGILAVFFLVVIALFVAGVIWAAHDDGGGRRFEQTNFDAALLPPTWLGSDSSELYVFGTDQLGRDLFARCLVGGALSLGVGLFAALIAVCVGTLWGTIAAVRGGSWDAAMMRLVDILYGLPSIMLVVLISVAASTLVTQSKDSLISEEFVNVVALFTAIGVVSWLTVSRVIRGQVKSVLTRPSLQACKVIGVSPLRTFTHHIFPAILGPIIVYATLTIPAAMLSEAFLSFLGIGIREPLPSWGNLASDGLSQLNPVQSRWWLLFWPSLCIASTLIVMNWLGNKLRVGLDPTLRMSS
ncbi:MAG: peptide ABC transporter permease [Phycisphaerae bacterium]|nr:peptide ABC transporter permease [Phycisphaerae bacterium]